MERIRSRRVLTAVLGVGVVGAILAISVAPASAHRGDPVNTFAGDGTTIVPNAPEEAAAQDVVVQSSGKVVVLSNRKVSFEAREIVVTRFTQRGTVDTSFGTDGQTTLMVDDVDTTAVAMAVQPDDRLVLVGSRGAGEAHGMLFVRLTADGDLDTTFSGDGVRVFDGGGFSFLDDVAIDRRNRIVAVGSIGDGIDTDPVIVRLRPDGSRDSRFARQGVARLRGEFPQVRYGRQIEIAPSGHLVVTIRSLAVEGEFYALLARLRANGSLDPTFGDEGYTSVPIDPALQVHPVGLDVDASGRIVTLVHARVEPGPWAAHVAVMTADGEPDATFSGDGLYAVPGVTGTQVAPPSGDVVVEASGRILVGLSEVSDSGADATVVALTATGRTDRSFSGDGAFTFDYIWEYESSITAMTVAGTRLYVVGAAAWPQLQPVEGGLAAIRLR